MSLVNRTFLGLAGAAAVLSLAVAAEAGTVVSVSGPSAGTYPVGTQIADTQRITLRQGDTLTVLDNGGTRVLSGPGTFILARQGGQARNSAISALTTQRSANRARTGAVRTGEAGPVTNPSLWYVDVAQSGTICLSNPSAVRLWRGDTAEETVYSVVPAGSPDEAVGVTFRESEMLALWDAALQLHEGETYTIGKAPDDEAAQVSFVFLEEVPEDVEQLALTLIENGCTVQLEQLSEAGAES